MGLWEAMRGRTRRVRPDLDSLFALPGAAITLRTAADLTPTGSGSVCFRAAEGQGFRHTLDEVIALLDADPAAPDVRTDVDSFGYTWLTVERSPDDVAGVCTDLHAVNSALEGQGFGPGLLCTLLPLRGPAGERVGLVYLYKQGTFYPFAPGEGQRRDHLLELRVRDAVAGELPWEQDPQRWLAVWGAPGL